MKHWIRGAAAFLTASLLLASCSGKVPVESSQTSLPAPEPIFSSVEEYPRVDGSTANLPLMARVLADTCGVSPEEAENWTGNTGTNTSWNRLVDGDVDLLLVYEAPADTQAR